MATEIATNAINRLLIEATDVPKSMSTIGWNAEHWGKWFVYIGLAFVVISFLIMAFDAVKRNGGQRLGAFHFTRFTWWFWGIAATFYLGNNFLAVRRTWIDKFFLEFNRGALTEWWRLGTIEIFENPITLTNSGVSTRID